MAESRRRLRSAPLGLLGMLALVAGVEGFVGGHPLEFTDPASLSWSLSAQAARTEARGAEILCFGDSLIKHGAIPAVFKAATGRETYNLSVCAGQAPATYFLLRRALEAGAKPRALVVEFAPFLLAGGPQYQERCYQELLTPREFLELAWVAHDPGFLARVGLGRLLPSVRGRHEIRAALRAACRGEASPMDTINRMCQRQWSVNAGSEYTPPNNYTGTPLPADRKVYMAYAFACQKVNAAFVKKFLALAASRRIPVSWILPPISPALQADRDRSGAEVAHEAYLRSLVARHPGLTVLDARRPGVSGSHFVDAAHLNGPGGATLSVAIAGALGRPAPPSRWVPLAMDREPPASVALEDVAGSKAFVEGTVRR